MTELLDDEKIIAEAERAAEIHFCRNVIVEMQARITELERLLAEAEAHIAEQESECWKCRGNYERSRRNR